MALWPGVDVVVVNWRTPEDLAGFIDSFRRVQYEVPCSLHVVNVEVTEEDVAVSSAGLETIEVPSSLAVWPGNIGYASACNSAAKMVADVEAARKTIAFFNADTRLTPGVLDACHWELHAHKDWAVIGPKQVDEQNRITHGGIYGTFKKPSFDGRWHVQDKGQYDELRDDCVSVSGSAYFVKRRVWDQLTVCPKFQEVAPEAQGAFLPTHHYYEETFASYHAIAHGFKVAYHGGVSMIHKWHQSSPLGGSAEKVMPASREYFRRACDHHGIAHE